MREATTDGLDGSAYVDPVFRLCGWPERRIIELAPIRATRLDRTRKLASRLTRRAGRHYRGERLSDLI